MDESTKARIEEDFYYSHASSDNLIEYLEKLEKRILVIEQFLGNREFATRKIK